MADWSTIADVTDDVIYVAISLRNIGTGIGVLQGWYPFAGFVTSEVPHAEPDEFRALTRDQYIPAGDVSFFQSALRDRGEDLFDEVAASLTNREGMTIELLYTDDEGGQSTISRFALSSWGEDGPWSVGVSRHWNLDRDGPR